MSDVKLFAIDAALFLFVDCYETFASARNSNSFEIKEFVCQDFIESRPRWTDINGYIFKKA